MTLEALGDYVLTAKYAGWNATEQRRETWNEMVDRVFAMHRRRYAGFGLEDEIAFAEGLVRERRLLGSQRALQFGGPAIEAKHARLYNCTVSYCDRPRFFQEALWLLLCGAGVGFSVQRHHTARLPRVARPDGKTVTYVIPDTIEGWSDALGVLLSSYFEQDQPFPGYAGTRVSFDYSLIRPEGSPLGQGTGKAPGPAPLRRSLELIRAVIESRLVEAGSPTLLQPIDYYDILMHASDAVISGGVRRSATICIFSKGDRAMAEAKSGTWFIDNPQRGRSNNSVLLLRDETSKAEFADLVRTVHEFGEPGFVWADSTEIMYNPCCEIGMYPVDTATGKSGWAFCNLCEINMKAAVDEEAFAESCRAAAILGTLQAGYTDFPYLGATTEAIVRREALLGVSMTGMMDNPELAFDPAVQRRMAQVVLDVNAELAERIGLAPCARATCVKPAGTTSCVLGTASGVHAHHSRRYLRRAQANRNEAPARFFEQHNPRAVENSVWNPNGTDVCIAFCVEIPEAAKTKGQLTALDMLEHVRSTQNNWVAAGRRSDNGSEPWLHHNVSNTITVREEEWETVTDHIYQHRASFAGISLLQDGGDLDYPQAPFCAILDADEILAEYGVGSLLASGLIVDGLHAFGDNLWEACDHVLGMRPPPERPVLEDDDIQTFNGAFAVYAAKLDWIRRAHKFARNYFDGKLRRMTHCLKRVHNMKLWEDLQREHVPVDYSLLHEEHDDTRQVEAVACAGGACQIL